MKFISAAFLSAVALSSSTVTAFTTPINNRQATASLHKKNTKLNEAVNRITPDGPPYAGPSSKPILDSVKFPHDMNRLDIKQLEQLAIVEGLQLCLK